MCKQAYFHFSMTRDDPEYYSGDESTSDTLQYSNGDCYEVTMPFIWLYGSTKSREY